MSIFDDAWNGLLYTADPSNALGLQKTKTPGLPAYQEQFAKDQAARAAAYAQAGTDVAGPYGGNIIGSGILGVDFANQPANATDTALTGEALGAIQGQVGDRITKPAYAAAQGIGAAGARNAAAQSAQLGQYGADLGIIRDSAMGQGPSAAQNLAQAQLEASIRSQAAMGATARGGNVAAGMRTAANAGSQMQLQSQAQTAALRAQEQLNAQGLLAQGNYQQAGALGAARGQDVSQAVAQAGAMGQLANTQAGIYGQGLQALGGVAERFDARGANELQALQAQTVAKQNYLNYLGQLYGTASGVPSQYAGIQGSMITQNAEAEAKKQAALMNTAGTVASAWI